MYPTVKNIQIMKKLMQQATEGESIYIIHKTARHNKVILVKSGTGHD